MGKVPRPQVHFPPAPKEYSQREEQEFRRLVALVLADPIEDVVRSSLSVTVTPAAAAHTIVVTYAGTMTYRIDGSTAIAGTASPQTLVVTRNVAPGPPIVYVFTCVKEGQTFSETVSVPPQPGTAESVITIPDQTADTATERYYYEWSGSGMPGGTTYDLEYSYAPVLAGIPETGTVTGANGDGTQYIASGGDVTATATYDITVRAMNGGSQIAIATRSGTFLT